MLNKEIAISAQGLGKAYKIFDKPTDRLSYHLFKKDKSTDFWALKDINFEVKRGETFGIIGKNGSGKSTLLQILAGIIKPTEGNLRVNGKIAALLELGSGFNPESTGLENIYMNAAILGIDKETISSKIDEIISFADIGEFINQSVKTYSSGMYVRLAFAVAINVDADIILIDEALAVGDIFFRQKCYKKLDELKEQGKTIILVTHAMGEAEQFCEKALLVNKGHQLMLGRSQDVVKQYYLLTQTQENVVSGTEIAKEDNNSIETKKFKIDIEDNQSIMKEEGFFDLNNSVEVSTGKVRFKKVGLFDIDRNACRVFEQGQTAYFYYEIEILEDIDVPVVGIVIYDQKNIIIHGKSTLQTYTKLPNKVKKGNTIKVFHKIDLLIKPEEFSFEVGISEISQNVYKNRADMEQEDMFRGEKRLSHRNNVGCFAVTVRKHGTPSKLLHHGICDLPVDIEIIDIVEGD
jgi:ABC-type polysaccharide/polyol phosphate transport system ATPase subunit